MSKIVKRLQNAWKALTDKDGQVTTTELVAQNSQPATPEHSWLPETALTRLVNEYKEDKTKWVFASDMEELLQKIDIFNATVNSDKKITILLHSKVDENLNDAINKGQHHENAEDVMAHIGPSFVGGIRMSVGGSELDMEYVYNVIESYLVFENQDGEVVKLYFGMDDMMGDLSSALTGQQPQQRQLKDWSGPN